MYEENSYVTPIVNLTKRARLTIGFRPDFYKPIEIVGYSKLSLPGMGIISRFATNATLSVLFRAVWHTYWGIMAGFDRRG